MKYILLKENGEEEGPIDQELLIRWIRSGKVKPNMKIRNLYLSSWTEVGKLSVYQDLKASGEIAEDNTHITEEDLEDQIKEDMVESLNQVGRTRFVPAQPLQRLCAWITDIVITLGPTVFILGILGTVKDMIQPSLYSFLGTFFLQLTPWWFLIYFTLGLGFKAQTFGQWFWGIMIIRTNGDPVYAGRAFLYILLAIFLWITSPLFYIIIPQRRTLPELLTGTRIIRITLRSV